MNLQALQTVSYGLYVIGSKKGDRLNGQIANTVFQVTSEPPMIAVAINKQNLTYEFIMESRVFSVSVLCEGTPLAFIGRFGFKSGRDTDKLAGINYKIGETGAPIVMDNAVAYLEARVVSDTAVGKHTLFVGEVVAAEVVSNETCMTYDHYRKVKRGTTPEAAPSYISNK